jgi:hypothetical protein
MSKFWKEILSAKGELSSRRLVTLIIALIFILAQISMLFTGLYVIFYLPKGRVEPELLAMLKQILEYDFYIILSGLGFVTVDGVTSILLEKAKGKTQNNEG